MIKSIFREYDIRGIFDKELNEQSVKLIGFFLGEKIKEIGGTVAIGYDARTHSPILRDYLASGLNHAGCRVLDMGMVATPVNYFANFHKSEQANFEVNASIMITGSHNPSEYNGFKITLDKAPFFGDDIYALGDKILDNLDMTIPDAPRYDTIDTKEEYIEYIIEVFSHLRGYRKPIIVDGGNGVAGTVLPQIFDALEFNYKAIYLDPDGSFPNHHPDPSEEENLIDIKKLLNGDDIIGFAYDGDADRVAVLTPRRNIKGDQMALLYAMNIKDPVVVGEVKCSQVMYDELERRGAKTHMYKTGHSNIKVKMREVDADLACEVSGHIFFKDRYFGYDDAIYATLRMIELLHNGIDIDKEIDVLPRVYSTPELKVETTEDKKFLIMKKIKELLENPPDYFPEVLGIIDIDGVRINFAEGWALVRASNTTPILVTRFESTDEKKAQEYEDSVTRLISQAMDML